MGVKDTANLAMIPAAYAEDKVYSVLPSDGDGDFTFTRTGSGTRINKGGYIETMAENVPRLNYRLDADGNPTGCAELLLEESRTNVFPVTEDFTNAQWFKSNSNVNGNTQISPNGTLTADTINVTSSNGGVFDFNQWQTTERTASVFAKKGTVNKIKIRNGSIPEIGVVFDLNNGFIESVTSSFSATMQAYPNDWYRLTVTHTASTNQTFAIVSENIGSFHLWGAQMEVGGNATSYIPNATTGTITRNKDSATITPFSDMASDYPITVYAKAKVTKVANTIFGLNNTSSQNYYLVFYFSSSTQVGVLRNTPSASDSDFYNYRYQIGDVKKIAIKFTSATAYKLYIDGIEIANVSSGTSINFDHDDISIGQLRITGDTGARNPVDELFVWNKALTDAEMVEVTSYDTFAEMATGQQFTIQ